WYPRRTLPMTLTRRLYAGAAVAAVAAAATLAACQKNPAQPGSQNVASAPPPLAAIPLASGTTAPPAPAPATHALPAAPPVRTATVAAPQDQYAFVDQAYQTQYGLGDAPPDYAFAYDGATPWSWDTDDGYGRVVEPVPVGDSYYYRDYYYEPGSDAPYLIYDD